MNTNHFHILSKHQALRNLLINGTCIGERKTNDSDVLLFQLHNYYIEIFLNINNDKIKARSFQNVQELKPYLEKTSL